MCSLFSVQNVFDVTKELILSALSGDKNLVHIVFGIGNCDELLFSFSATFGKNVSCKQREIGREIFGAKEIARRQWRIRRDYRMIDSHEIELNRMNQSIRSPAATNGRIPDVEIISNRERSS